MTKVFNIKDDKWRLDANEFVKFFLAKHEYKLLGGKPMNKTAEWWKESWYKDLQQKLIGELEENFNTITRKMVSDCMFFLVRTWEDKNIINYIDGINPYGIHLVDGVYDINAKKFSVYTEHQHMYVKNFLPYTYKDLMGPDSPREFIKFLKTIFKWEWDVDDNIKFIQEYMGLLLIPNTMFQKALFIFGTGGNGKWVLLKVIENMLGDTNCAAAGINELMDKTTSYNLIGKLCNIDYDIFSQAFLDKEVLKKIISWEKITTKQLYSQPISFKPFARIVCASNYMPKVRHVDKSVSRRFYFMELRNSFVGREDIHLATKLAKENRQILVWAFNGLQRLIKSEKFTIPKQLLINEQRFLNSR